MNIRKSILDPVVTVVAAVSAPALTLCVDAGALSSSVATDVGAIVAAAVIAYHGGAAVQRTGTDPSLADTP